MCPGLRLPHSSGTKRGGRGWDPTQAGERVGRAGAQQVDTELWLSPGQVQVDMDTVLGGDPEEVSLHRERE